jgi:hypothetical protein
VRVPEFAEALVRAADDAAERLDLDRIVQELTTLADEQRPECDGQCRARRAAERMYLPDDEAASHRVNRSVRTGDRLRGGARHGDGPPGSESLLESSAPMSAGPAITL